MSMSYELKECSSVIKPKTETWTESASVWQTFPPNDPSPMQRMKLIETSGSLSFWDDPSEDIYDKGGER